MLHRALKQVVHHAQGVHVAHVKELGHRAARVQLLAAAAALGRLVCAGPARAVFAGTSCSVPLRTMRLLMRKQFVDVPPADKLAAMARLLQKLELSFFKTDDDASASFMPWCRATLFQPLAVFLAHAFAVSGTRLKMLVPLVAAANRGDHDSANAVCVPTGTTEASVFVTRTIARGERVVITTRPSRSTDARLLAAAGPGHHGHNSRLGAPGAGAVRQGRL